MQLQIDNRFRELEAFLGRIKAAHADQETQSYLCKFGAVLVCGNLERCIEIIILGRLAHLAQPRILEFIKSYFKKGKNYDCAAIEQLLIRFDSDWYRRFHDFIETQPDIKEGVSSCYSVRNSVAHGGAGGIGYVRLEELARVSRRLVDAVVACTA